MDPTVCYRNMMKAWENDELSEAQDCATNLSDWLSKNGFPPHICGDKTCDLAQAMSDIDFILEQ